MVQLKIKTTSIRERIVNVSTDDTPKQVFAAQEIDVSGSTCNLDGVPLTARDMNCTFAELGVKDGESVTIHSVVKADGANN